MIALLTGIALAGDTWTTIEEGVEYLHRTTSEPQDIYAVRVDLSLPQVALHASADNDEERHVNTRTFARNTGALVAINGDWSDSTTPVGLAISDGQQWHDHYSDESIGGHWGYVGCTIDKQCTLSREEPLGTAWWFAEPTRSPYRYYQAIGANGILLVVGGVAQSGCYDSVQNPRSAICVEEDRVHMWMVAVDGRTSEASGMTCDEMRDLMLDLGCWDAAMLDGGGSTTLVIEGTTMNNPSDGSLRTVANHIGVMVHSATDSSCRESNALFCETDSVIVACQGGQETGRGDCAYYGATCEEDGSFAYCVDYRCPGGSGTGVDCLGDTEVAWCTDGVYAEGDCGAFGLVCGEDAEGGDCMDPRCEAGPHSGFCLSEGLLAACVDGLYGETTCGEGTTCTEAEGTASCATPEEPGGDGAGEAGGEGSGGEEGGGADGGGSADGGSGDGDGEGEATVIKGEQAGGCAAAPMVGGAAPLLAALGLRRRRR